MGGCWDNQAVNLQFVLKRNGTKIENMLFFFVRLLCAKNKNFCKQNEIKSTSSSDYMGRGKKQCSGQFEWIICTSTFYMYHINVSLEWSCFFVLRSFE